MLTGGERVSSFANQRRTRRQSLKGLAVSILATGMATTMRAANQNVAYGQATIPAGIRSRFVENINGLKVHILEAGFEVPGRPCVLLLHGFPELAYSWRKVMLPIAAAGYHVVAPDLRGYGRTTGWDANYDGDLGSFSILNSVRDTLSLVLALGYRSVVAVIGHDAGSPLGAWCALIRPDVFRSVAMMSAPLLVLRFCLSILRTRPELRPWPRLEPTFMSSLRSSHARENTTCAFTRLGRPTTTCCIVHRDCTLFYAPIITTRVLTGRRISHSR